MKWLAGLALLLPLVMGVCARADDDTGGFRGRVVVWHEPDRGVSDAIVTIVGPSGSYTTVSGHGGFYVVLGMLPGAYRVSAAPPASFGSWTNACWPRAYVDAGVVRDLTLQVVRGSVLIDCFFSARRTLFDPAQTADVYEY